MNENELSYYPENISMKDGKVLTQSTPPASLEKKDNRYNILMSLLGNNKNLTDLLPLLLTNGNFSPEQLSGIIKNISPQNSKEKNKKKIERTKFEEL